MDTGNVTEWTTVTANIMTIIGGLSVVVTCMGTIYVALRKGLQIISAIVAIAKLSEQLPAVVQGYETIKSDVAEIKVGQDKIVASQESQKKRLDQFERDLGGLRRHVMGHGKTHEGLKAPLMPPEGLDYADEDETE